MRILTVVALATLPYAAFAAGSDSTEPPKPTATTLKCTKGLVYDDKARACKPPKSSGLDNDALFGAVRELAYAGRYDDALDALSAMDEGESDRVLTYLGFLNRKSGKVAEGMVYYARALQVNPDNILARSYMGQALVLAGDIGAANMQLAEIRQRGGTGTWAETSLARAVGTGKTSDY